MFELPGAGFLKVAGADADKVINNQTTNDIKKLAAGHLCETFFTNVRGWCGEHGFAFKLAGEVLLVGQFGNPAYLASHIERYIVREDARVENLSEQKTLLLINSDEVTAVANAFGLRAFRPQTGELHTCSMGDLQLLIAATSMLQAGDQLMVIDTVDRSKILTSLASAGVKLQSESEFEWRRILSFWPRAGREIVEKSLPQELDRDASAISFTKGCYLGQETIARLDARGQLQKKLCLLRIDTTAAIPISEPVLRGELPIGSITSIATNTSAGYSLALAYLKRGNFEVGTSMICGNFPAAVMLPQR